MWKKVTIGILIFIVGFVTSFIIIKTEETVKKKEKMRAIALQEFFMDDFKTSLDCYQMGLMKNNINNEFELCEDMQSLCKQCSDMEHSILVHVIDIDSLEVLKANVVALLTKLDKTCYIEDSKTVLSSINNDDFSTSEKLNQLYAIENILVYHYLSHIYKESAIISYAELLSIAKSDTIRLGEEYVSKLIFSVKDVTDNKSFYRMLNDSTVQPIKVIDSEFREVPTEKGFHHQDILYEITGFYMSKFYKVSIDYYVK